MESFKQFETPPVEPAEEQNPAENPAIFASEQIKTAEVGKAETGTQEEKNVEKNSMPEKATAPEISTTEISEQIPEIQVAEKIKDYMKEDELPQELQERVTILVNETLASYKEISVNNSREQLTEKLLNLASARAGLEELRIELLSKEDSELTKAQQGILAGLIQHIEFETGALPQIQMEATPEEGIKQLHKALTEQKESSYSKLIGIPAEKIRQKVEDTVQSWLERLADRIPSKERERLIQGASKLSGKLAFGATAFGLSLLALGTGGVREAFGAVEITENKDNDSFEIKNEDTHETVIIVPLDQLDKFSASNQKNEIYEKFIGYDNKASGVNYNIDNTEKFTATVIEDAKTASQDIFHKNLSELNVPEFIKLTNALVQNKIEYEYSAIQKNQNDNLTPEAKIASNKISNMPLDEMYLSYGKGVCRHYAALVEKVGETLIQQGLVPQVEGLSIDEIVGDTDAGYHAWNIYYLNSEQNNKETVISFTDATWDDDTKEFFDALEARDKSHASISGGLLRPSIFSNEDLKEIYEKLIEFKIGPLEERAMRHNLAQIYLSEYHKTIGEKINIDLNDEIARSETNLKLENILKKAIEHSENVNIDKNLGVGSYAVSNKDMSREAYFNFISASFDLIQLFEEQNKFREAISYARSAASFSNNSYDRFIFIDYTAELRGKMGDIEGAEKSYKYAIDYAREINDSTKLSDNLSRLEKFYIEHNMDEKLALLKGLIK